MGKIGTRVLPPLVNGKLTGLLELTVDKVEITENFFKNENFSFVVKILWWGETKPLYIRPKRIQFTTQDNKKIIKTEDSTESAKYEVRTKVKLFKSYLSKCDVMEMAILDAAKSEVIGSVFLKDLLILVYNTHYFTSSVINHCGVAIGEMSCHFMYSEVDNRKGTAKEKNTQQIVRFCEKRQNRNELKLNLSGLENSREDTTQAITRTYKLDSHDDNSMTGFVLSGIDERQTLPSYRPQECQTLHYNSPVTGNSDAKLNSDVQESTETVNNTCEFERKEEDKHNDFEIRETAKVEHLVEDASLNIGISSRAPVIDLKSKKSVTVHKSIKKFNGVTMGCRVANDRSKDAKGLSNVKRISPNSKTKFPTQPNFKTTAPAGKIVKSIRNGSTGEKVLPKVSKGSISNSGAGKLRTFVKVSREISNLNQIYLSPNRAICETSNPESTFVEHEGATALKEEKLELNVDDDYINCRNLANTAVASVPDGDICKSGCESKSNSGKKVNINDKLFFDLDNPIEKLYYETFFNVPSKTMDANEFEIVELLNQPGNKYGLVATSEERNREKCNVKTEKKVGAFSVNKKEVVVDEEFEEVNTAKTDSAGSGVCKTKNSETSETRTRRGSFESNCYRCKYFKKLAELDKIIEVLKRFEMTMREETSNRNDEMHGGKGLSDDPIASPTIPIDRWVDGKNIDFSDFSKEDSDFVEFTDYLSKR